MKRTAEALAKLSVPHTGATVARRRLFQKLDRAIAARQLVWIVAPPGAGKTTLVSSYLRARKRPTFWYAMDSGDTDLATVFHFLARGTAVVGKSARPNLPPLTPERRLGLDVFTREFFEELGAELPAKAVLVFDNHQEVGEGEAMLDILVKGASCLRDGQRIFVVSRQAPPASLAALEVAGRLTRIGEDDLRFTLHETSALARLRHKGKTERGVIAKLHARTHGWAAGVVMLLEHARAGDADATPQVVLDYLAREYLDRLPETTRHVLEAVARAPYITIRMATELGVPEAPSVLARLARRGAFVTHREHPVPSHEIHPLLRELLIAREERDLSAAVLAGRRRSVAKVCADEGNDEAAVSLYAANGDWRDVIALAAARGPALIARGQHETLERWLARVPSELRTTDARVAYWLGRCANGKDPPRALGQFTAAFALYAEKEDREGQLDAWAYAVYNIVAQFDDMTALDPWIARFDALVGPSELASVRSPFVIANLLCAMNYRGFDHPRGAAWRTHGLHLLELEEGDPASSLYLAYGLARCFRYVGNMPGVRVVGDIARRIRAAGGDPLVEIYASATDAFVALQCGDTEGCRRSVAAGLAVANVTGIPVWNHLLGTLGAVSALLCGDITAGRRHLDTIARQTPRGARRLAVAHCAHLSAFASLLEGDLTLALEGAKSAVRTITALGALVPEALSRLLLAEIHAARGELTDAEAVLTELRKVGGASESAFVESQVQFIEARISDHRGQRNETLAHVSRALSLAARFGAPLLLTFLTTPESFARLCALGMSENIEVAAAQALVRARPVGDFAPRASLVSWPWLVRVQLLGTFRVELDGKELVSVGKQQARVLELLQLLVVEGGSAPESTLSDRLWREADGDKAEQALSITLHRLRALLGDPTLVVRRAGEVALDRARVFADLWAIDALLEDARRAERATDQREARRTRALAETLYAGSPTPVRRGSPPWWLIAEGSRLAARFAQNAPKSAEKRPN